MKSARQLVQPESVVFWSLNVLLHLSEAEIQRQFDMTAGQVKRLKQGKVTDSLLSARLRHFLQRRAEELRETVCREKCIAQHRLAVINCLDHAVGLTLPKRLMRKRQHRAYNRIEDATAYLTRLLQDEPAAKHRVKEYTIAAGFDWRMVLNAARQLGIRTASKKWRLKND